MSRKKIILLSFSFILLCVVGYGVFYAWISFPIISGYGAKGICSCVFAAGRTEADVKKEELGDFPFTLGNYTINWTDSSVIGTVWGMARRKAIYRKGIGCTVINDIPEKEVRSQSFTIPLPPAINTDTIPWPLGDRLTDSFPAGLNKDKLLQAVTKAFEEPNPDKKSRTRAVVVVYKGQLVAEKYAAGFDRNSKMHGWSMAKSIMAALVGILVKQGKLNVNQPAAVPEWQSENDPRKKITLEKLLQQTSGLRFKEDYTGASNVTNMLFKRGDMAAYTAGLHLAHEPGTVFNYSSGNSNLLSRIIRQTVGEKDYASFPAIALFYKIGMYNTFLEPDASGSFVGSSYIFATARDYARFGMLYLEDGVWNNERILPEGWVKQTMNSPAANKLKNYGYQFWLNGIRPQTGHRFYPDSPADMFYADGYAFQDIYIIPSERLVVVRLGLTLDRSFNENEFLKNILEAVDNRQ